ncbi:MAG: iron-containing alcohol dehydrogenase [Chloroflexi bacterium]|nr:iron-containing alcohol dehydrogenase [Chloroflexota bacterium]MCL5026440.1 iron-containing alcohol dehydrogenase [Chloroflexota bacterium]
MATFDFRIPSLLVVGAGASQRAGVEARRLAQEGAGPGGGGRALLVTDQNLVRLGHVEPVVASLREQGLEVTLFSEVNTEPTTEHVERGLAVLRREGCNVVMALGGGAPMDAGKAIAVMATNPGAMTDYMGQDKVPAPKLPLVCIPTTAGTGSEATRFTIITDPQTRVKMLIGSPFIIPTVSLVDYTLTMTCPQEVTAGSGVDAFIHALEAYISKRANPVSDALALSAMERVAKNIRRAWADGNDAVAREQMALGALEAGMAFSNASVALIHGMSRPIGAYFHVPHGLSNAMLLSAVTRFNQEAAAARLAAVAEVMGAGRTAPAAVRAIAVLCHDLEIPGVREYGIDPDKFMEAAPQMARDAIASGSPANNPRSATEDEIVALYRKVL